MKRQADINPVLILGDEPRIAVPIARSLARRGIPVDVAALSLHAPPLPSRAVRRFVRLPDPWQEPHVFIDLLADFIDAKGHDLLLPASDTALAAVSRYYGKLSARLRVGCPHPQVVRRVLDKVATLQAAEQCGINVPKTYRISGVTQLEAVRSELRFPMIVKPAEKWGACTFKVRHVSTFEELREALTTMDPQIGFDCLCQEYCPGEGVGIETLIHRGRPLVVFQHRRLKELPSTGGVSVVSLSEPVNPVLCERALRLLRVLEWEGVAMIEFRENRDDQTAALMEVNGRYWGSLPLSFHAGLDFPWYEWQLAHGRIPDVPTTYRTGVRVRWTSGAIRRLYGMEQPVRITGGRKSRVQELVGCARDLLPPTKDALWSFRDPLPALSETARTIHAIVRSEAKGLLARLLPQKLLDLWKRYRQLGPYAGRVYVKAAVLRAVGLRKDRLPAKVLECRSVLFVCHGNIIRSPMAAALLKRSLAEQGRADVRVESAGLHAHPLNGPDPRAVKVAAEFGVSLQSHRAQPVTQALVEGADVVFVMDAINEAELLGRYPDVRTKLFLLGACSSWLRSDIEIKDPYHGGIVDIRSCYERIRQCVQHLVHRLGVPNIESDQPVSCPGAPRLSSWMGRGL